eukprot:7204332-Alexandrium_andersonii.AAC.1
MEVEDNPSPRRVARGGVECRARREDPPPRGGVRGTIRRAGSEPADGGLRGEVIYVPSSVETGADNHGEGSAQDPSQ